MSKLVKATELSGAGTYPANRLNKRERKVLETAEEYAASTATNWAGNSPATTITAALDRIAAALAALSQKP